MTILRHMARNTNRCPAVSHAMAELADAARFVKASQAVCEASPVHFDVLMVVITQSRNGVLNRAHAATAVTHLGR
tara:strand:- start:38 stop:262 length:225 start_codon:yes stop_codon:yes gene_type:complete